MQSQDGEKSGEIFAEMMEAAHLRETWVPTPFAVWVWADEVQECTCDECLAIAASTLGNGYFISRYEHEKRGEFHACPFCHVDEQDKQVWEEFINAAADC